MASLHANCYTTPEAVGLVWRVTNVLTVLPASGLGSQAGGLTAAFALGFWAAHPTDFGALSASAAANANPAYVIVSAKVPHPDKLGPYREAAVPLAEKAGMEVLAAGDSGSSVRVLEGD